MKKGLLIGLSTTILATGVYGASAYTGNKTDYTSPFTWNQTDQYDVATFGPNGLDWRMASCMIQTATFLKIKTGSADIGYAPKDLKLTLDKTNGYASTGYLSYKKVDFGDDWYLYGAQEEHGVRAATYDDVIRYYKEGYVIGMRVISPAGPHFIAVDHIDEDGTIYIFDSGFRGTKFTDTYNKNSITDVVLLKSKSGKKGYDLPTLYNHVAGTKLYDKVDQNTKAESEEDKAKEVKKLKIIADARKAEKLKKVEYAVSNAENSKDEKQITYAHTLVSSLEKSERTDFIKRLNNIKKG